MPRPVCRGFRAGAAAAPCRTMTATLVRITEEEEWRRHIFGDHQCLSTATSSQKQSQPEAATVQEGVSAYAAASFSCKQLPRTESNTTTGDANTAPSSHTIIAVDLVWTLAQGVFHMLTRDYLRDESAEALAAGSYSVATPASDEILPDQQVTHSDTDAAPGRHRESDTPHRSVRLRTSCCIVRTWYLTRCNGCTQK
jgi:hypothetical protein